MTANQGEAAISPAQYEGRVPVDSFSNRLVLARRLAGLTIEEAADAADLSKSSWANWENGRRPQDQPEVCRIIAAALDVDFHWLLFGGPLLPARGRPTRRKTKRSAVDNCGYHGSPVGAGPATGRPMSSRPKGRKDHQRPSSPAVTGRRANYVGPIHAAEATNLA